MMEFLSKNATNWKMKAISAEMGTWISQENKPGECAQEPDVIHEKVVVADVFWALLEYGSASMSTWFMWS